jgi:hypothetical protein
MILEILKRTPPWVFLIFAALLVLGTLQSRTRALSTARLTALPAALLGLSMFSMLSTVGPNALAWGGWLAAWLAGAAAIAAMDFPKGASYSAETHAFLVPGSWLPLALMMAIFFERYAVAVAVARNGALGETMGFAAAVGVAYGLPSGIFAGRAWNILRQRNRAPAAA